jgi:hypothetical protein
MRKLEEEEVALERSMLALQPESLPSEAEETAGIHGDDPVETDSSAEQYGPRVVPLRDRKRPASQLAEELVENLAKSLSKAESSVLEWVEKVLAALWEDVERQRSSTGSLVGIVAERLRHQEETLSSLQKTTQENVDRLDRHTEMIRSITEAQASHATMLGQLLEVLRLLRAAVQPPSALPRLDNRP